jgi:hypothetical protein
MQEGSKSSCVLMELVEEVNSELGEQQLQ